MQYRPTVRISIDRQQGSPAALAMRQPISVGAADRLTMIGLEAKRTGAVDWKRGCAGHFGSLEVPEPEVQKRPLSSPITPLRPIERLYRRLSLFHRCLGSGPSPSPLDRSSSNQLFAPRLPPDSMVWCGGAELL